MDIDPLDAAVARLNELIRSRDDLQARVRKREGEVEAYVQLQRCTLGLAVAVPTVLMLGVIGWAAGWPWRTLVALVLAAAVAGTAAKLLGWSPIRELLRDPLGLPTDVDQAKDSLKEDQRTLELRNREIEDERRRLTTTVVARRRRYVGKVNAQANEWDRLGGLLLTAYVVGQSAVFLASGVATAIGPTGQLWVRILIALPAVVTAIFSFAKLGERAGILRRGASDLAKQLRSFTAEREQYSEANEETRLERLIAAYESTMEDITAEMEALPIAPATRTLHAEPST